jgi:hypothetical protein
MQRHIIGIEDRGCSNLESNKNKDQFIKINDAIFFQDSLLKQTFLTFFQVLLEVQISLNIYSKEGSLLILVFNIFNRL